MSQERVSELYREGFITSLMGIDRNLEYHVMDNKYGLAYREGRKDGHKALYNYSAMQNDCLKIRNRLDGIVRAHEQIAKADDM